MKKWLRNRNRWQWKLRKNQVNKMQVTLCEELQRSRSEFPPHDSEDSLGPEDVADELRRLTSAHTQTTGSVSTREPRGGATAPDAAWENHGPYAPQRSRRNRGRPVSPDPLMFRSTIWLEHDQEASARAHEEPIEQCVIECVPWKLIWRH